MNALVFGGTRYFGKRLVELLLAQGTRVTIVTRGQTPDEFGERVERLRVDRSDRAALERALGDGEWDIVFDNICYSPNEALTNCALLAGRTKRLIHTSTQSVYTTFDDQREADFDSRTYVIRAGRREHFDYGEGKRLAEAAYVQRATFPVAAVRIPIVLGPDDYTRRLEFHVERIVGGRPLVVPNPLAETSFITSDEAARFLHWISKQKHVGPVNACSDGSITIAEIIRLIEKASKHEAIIHPEGPEEDHTPFVDRESRRLDNALARQLGFRFTKTHEWLAPLISLAVSRFAS